MDRKEDYSMVGKESTWEHLWEADRYKIEGYKQAKMPIGR